MSPDAKIFHELWQSAERELTAARNERFEEIIKSLNYDGSDTNSLTVGEIRRSISEQSSGPTGSPSALDTPQAGTTRPGACNPAGWMGDISGTPYGPSDR